MKAGKRSLILLVVMILFPMVTALFLENEDASDFPEGSIAHDGPFAAYLRSGSGDDLNEDVTLEQFQQEDDMPNDERSSVEVEAEASSSSSGGSVSLQEFTSAKILDDKTFDYSSRSSFKEDIHAKFSEVQPFQFYGPPTLGFLDGMCIKHEVGRFEYTICPFQNITNKRVSSHRISLLGRWDGWSPFGSDDPTLFYNYSLMQYGRGDACGGDTKTATLVLGCGELYSKVEVVDVDENIGPCDYSIVLGLPIHCSLLLGNHPSAYLGKDINTGRGQRGKSNIDTENEMSLSDLLAAEENRLTNHDGFSTGTGQNSGDTVETYAEQILNLRKQVEELTARLQASLIEAEGEK